MWTTVSFFHDLLLEVDVLAVQFGALPTNIGEETDEELMVNGEVFADGIFTTSTNVRKIQQGVSKSSRGPSWELVKIST